MSRVGKYPVEVPAGVTVTLSENSVTVKGKLGEMSMPLLSDLVEAKMEENTVVISPKTEQKKSRMMWGTTRANIANMVKGVSEGFSKKLLITGVGYRAQAQGNTLKLSLGFSHDVDFPIPQDLKITTPSQTEIEISGSDKQRVGQIASEIRGYRPPEPYKGKGVRYSDEQILRKEGKKK
jgi:large subunit ribosomal protein L6